MYLAYLSGFQDLLTPILAGVLESIPAKMITFPEFFSKVQDLVTRTVSLYGLFLLKSYRKPNWITMFYVIFVVVVFIIIIIIILLL
jgi:hypothetical protein